MSGFSGSNHVQVHVHEAVQEVGALLDERAVEAVGPEGPAPVLLVVETLPDLPLGLLHEPADSLGIVRLDDEVNLIAGDAVPEAGDRELPLRFREEGPIPISGDLARQKELAVVAPVREMADPPREDASIRSGHRLFLDRHSRDPVQPDDR
jgi:hypothetical protein